MGCKKKIKAIEQDNHEKTCTEKMVTCDAKDVMCPWTGKRSEFQSHSTSCVYLQLHPVLIESRRKQSELEKTITDLSKKMTDLTNIVMNKNK